MIQKSDQQAYLRKLLGYNFRIEYKTSSSNNVVDAFSRQFEDQFSLFSMASPPIADFLSILHEENSSLPKLQLLHKQLLDRQLSPTYSVRDGLLLYHNRYYINPHSSLKDQLLHEFHSTPLAGHERVKCTLVRLSAVVFWLHMCRDVRNFVEACLCC